MFYSKSTGGFYDRAIHGDNIPADAVEITAEQHAALLTGQSEGKRIVADANGYPILVDPQLPDPVPPTILEQITAIESTITNRRLREAALTEEGKAWLAAKDAEIAALRAQL